MKSNAANNFDVLSINLDVLHNYFDSLLILFFFLRLANF